MRLAQARAERVALRPSGHLAGRRHGAWVVTVLATVASTYALDAFAIAIGALLATSGLLAGLDRPLLLAFLGASYVVWGAGLRANLAANWSLLARTGASTNVLSKAAHDMARARGAGARGLRFAASAGYVLTELAKEVPYYASASGAVLLSDGVSAGDAIAFLAGTNLGAAMYEYGLARATRSFLRIRPGSQDPDPRALAGGRPVTSGSAAAPARRGASG
jgi:hypothetical protein